MLNCTTCRLFDSFAPRPDEPSGNGCRSTVDGPCYVLDTTKPPCAYGGSRPLSYIPNATQAVADLRSF